MGGGSSLADTSSKFAEVHDSFDERREKQAVW
jgi:hypothetical protein